MKRAALMVLMAVTTEAQGAGTTGAFLKIPPSVRGSALGGIQPAVGMGAQAIGTNPGNLALLGEGYEVTSGFAATMGESRYGHVAGAMRMGNEAVGASVTMLRTGSMEGRDGGGIETGSFVAQDMAVGLSLAGTTAGGIRAGVTGKVIQSSIGSYRAKSALAGDFGLGWGLGRVGLGLSALNVGSGSGYQGGTAKLPTSYQGGVTVDMGPVTGSLGAGRMENDKKTFAGLGMEYNIGPLSMRLGYRSEGGNNPAAASAKGGAALGGMTGGVGMVFRGMRLDYAMSPAAAEWGNTHRVAMTFKWGGAPVSGEEVYSPRAEKEKNGDKVIHLPKPISGSHRAY